MNKTALKSNLHKLIDQIDNQILLEEFYQELKTVIQKSQVNVWDSLTNEQKKEVLLSYEEREEDQNLIDNNTVMDKYKNWL